MNYKPFIIINTFNEFKNIKLSADSADTTYITYNNPLQVYGSPDILWKQLIFVLDKGIIYTRGKMFTNFDNIIDRLDTIETALTENQINIVNITYSELTNNTLSVNNNNYYNISGNVDTLNVTLNHTSKNVIQKIIINLSTGTTPQITFSTNISGETISYFDYYSINANSNYELNIIWNGTKWIVAHNSYYNS